mmetsp:Transcript_12322/g.22982  ORF Transcript_12322/g.22982 Transcript_12322/m.22982 type:complete len:195 (-) Transcript_12322:240-824(-)
MSYFTTLLLLWVVSATTATTTTCSCRNSSDVVERISGHWKLVETAHPPSGFDGVLVTSTLQDASYAVNNDDDDDDAVINNNTAPVLMAITIQMHDEDFTYNLYSEIRATNCHQGECLQWDLSFQKEWERPDYPFPGSSIWVIQEKVVKMFSHMSWMGIREEPGTMTQLLVFGRNDDDTLPTASLVWKRQLQEQQ